MPSRFKFSIRSAMTWTAMSGICFAMFRVSGSLSQSIFVMGCCAVIIGLLQQVVWIKRLEIAKPYRNSQRLAITWRIMVAAAMMWAGTILVAYHHDFFFPSPDGSWDAYENAFFDLEDLAIATLAVGCLCGIMTAPWLRLNRLAQSSVPSRSYVYATLAAIPLALYTAFDRGAIVGLVDIAIQSVLNGMSEPVAVSSGTLPTSLSRGNAMTRVFVNRSIVAWVGAVIALVIVSIVARNSFRARLQWIASLVALAFTTPTVIFLYWFGCEGYEKLAPHLWGVHEWPIWQAWTLAILPLGALTVFLSIKRQAIEVPPQDTPPVFLCDSFMTYFIFVAVPMISVWQTAGPFLRSGIGKLIAGTTGIERLTFAAQMIVSEAMLSANGMLLTTMGALCFGASLSRIRYGNSNPRKLTLVRSSQIALAMLTLVLVLLVVLCTIPMGVSVFHVGI